VNRPNPTPARLNAIDLTVRLGGPSAERATGGRETVRDTDPGDDKDSSDANEPTAPAHQPLVAVRSR